jgi:hypothetical protein
MNILQALIKRFRLHLVLNRVFYSYWLCWFLLFIGMIWSPLPTLVKAGILGTAIAPLMIGIAVAEMFYLFKTKGWKDFWRRRKFGFWCGAVFLSLVMTLVAYVQAPENGWPISLAIGFAIGFGVPLHGHLSGGFYKRMISRGLM